MAWKPDYITGAELGDYLKIEYAVDADETLLAEWATTASRDVDAATGRQFGNAASAVERSFETKWSPSLGMYVAEITDLYDTTGLTLTVDGESVDVDDIDLWPLNAVADGKVYERITVATPGRLRATTDKWGWAAVPASIKIASKLQGARLAFRRGAAHGIAGSPEQGSEQRLTAAYDVDLKTSVRPYVRKWYAA